jgi:hypothetical protein
MPLNDANVIKLWKSQHGIPWLLGLLILALLPKDMSAIQSVLTLSCDSSDIFSILVQLLFEPSTDDLHQFALIRHVIHIHHRCSSSSGSQRF